MVVVFRCNTKTLQSEIAFTQHLHMDTFFNLFFLLKKRKKICGDISILTCFRAKMIILFGFQGIGVLFILCQSKQKYNHFSLHIKSGEAGGQLPPQGPCSLHLTLHFVLATLFGLHVLDCLLGVLNGPNSDL